MTTFGKLVSLTILIGIITLSYFLFGNKNTLPEIISTTTKYTNDTYHFTIEYPNTFVPKTTFKPFHNLSTMWRVHAQENEQGTPLLSIPIYSVDQGGVATGKAYPLFFNTEVRIGVSDVTSTCYTPDEGFTNQTIIDTTINGIPFKKFLFSDAAMMQFMEGVSYRTIHNNQCYVIEQLKTGSNYRDETMSTGIPESELQNYYLQGESIIQTFKFTE